MSDREIKEGMKRFAKYHKERLDAYVTGKWNKQLEELGIAPMENGKD